MSEKEGKGSAAGKSAALDEAAALEGTDVIESGETPESSKPSETASEDESARALAEHNALARVFDDVRAQSRAGNLVAPTRWEEIGLVPGHMAAEEFEMFVYDWWEGEHPGEGLDADSLGTPQTRAAERSRTEKAATSARRTSAASSSAVHGVGVPPFLRAEEESDPASSATESEPEPAEPARTAESACADGPDDDPSTGLKLPEGYKLAQVEGEWVLVPDEDAEPVELPIDCKDIAALIGRYSYYLYDRTLMTDAYAHWAFLAAEDDEVVTFVDCVREESRTYPRPMPVESLENEPFRFSRERILGIWDEVCSSGDYPDIQQTSASNGDIFFYSTRYLDSEYARSLAEWAAVERLRNV